MVISLNQSPLQNGELYKIAFILQNGEMTGQPQEKFF